MTGDRAVLVSIKPKWCDLIVSGQKIAEIRKTKPDLRNGPMKVYIYRTGRGKVIGEFMLRKYVFLQAWIDVDGYRHLGNSIGLRHCVDDEELFNYLYREPKPGKPYPGGWAWIISDLVVYDEPKALDLCFGIKRPPQSWCYVKEL